MILFDVISVLALACVLHYDTLMLFTPQSIFKDIEDYRENIKKAAGLSFDTDEKHLEELADKAYNGAKIRLAKVYLFPCLLSYPAIAIHSVILFFYYTVRNFFLFNKKELKKSSIILWSIFPQVLTIFLLISTSMGASYTAPIIDALLNMFRGITPTLTTISASITTPTIP